MSVRIIDHTDEILDDLEAAIETGLEGIGIQAENYAALELENYPRRVDTGLLRNSITHAVSGKSAAKGSYTSDDGTKSGSYSGAMPDDENKSVYIGTNVDYAGYVHDGTSRMAANRFLAKAASGHKAEYVDIMKQALEQGG